MSGLAEVTRISGGIVAGGLSEALWLGTSAYRLSPGSKWVFMWSTIFWRTLSCCHVYLPWFRATGQALSICRVVGEVELHKSQWASVQSYHRLKLRGVGRVLEPAHRRKDSWPAGSPCWILFQTLLSLSSYDISKKLFWTLKFWSDEVINDVFFVQDTDCFRKSFPGDGSDWSFGNGKGGYSLWGDALTFLGGITEGYGGNFCNQGVGWECGRAKVGEFGFCSEFLEKGDVKDCQVVNNSNWGRPCEAKPPLDILGYHGIHLVDCSIGNNIHC